jgi:hypothetical protein
MEELVTLLHRDISGELDFVLSDHILYEEGNIGIPGKWIPELYKSAVMAFKGKDSNLEKKLDATMVLICLNPDNYTAVNFRKKMLLEGVLDKEREYPFIKFILTKHLNKPMLWAHLYWLYKQGWTNPSQDLDLCTFAADRYRCNYPCWSFRRKLLSNHVERIHDELQQNREFVKKHISDSSGWSYRVFLILILPDSQVLQSEYDWIRELIRMYPQNESLWYYFRVLHKRNVHLEWHKDTQQFLASLDPKEHGIFPSITSMFLEKAGKNVVTLPVPSGIELPHYVQFFSNT